MIIQFQENRVRRAYFGGKRIDAFKGNPTGEDSRYPEEWLASAVTAFNPDCPKENEGLSRCLDGTFFKDVVPAEKMSILVKLLDAAERLVIQCHPTVEFAKTAFHSNFGKTECWYMVEPEPDAYVYLGFKPGITKEKWQTLFLEQDIDGLLNCLHKFPVKKGDLWFVNGGVPHAIGPGCFMIELQEPSDLMVIPEKVTPSGVPLHDQKLHGGLGFEKMFDCFHYNGQTAEEVKALYCRHPKTVLNTPVAIVDADLTEKFGMQRLTVEGSATVDFKEKYAVAVVTAGNGTLCNNGKSYNLKKGDSFYLTENSGILEFCGSLELVFCTC